VDESTKKSITLGRTIYSFFLLAIVAYLSVFLWLERIGYEYIIDDQPDLLRLTTIALAVIGVINLIQPYFTFKRMILRGEPNNNKPTVPFR